MLQLGLAPVAISVNRSSAPGSAPMRKTFAVGPATSGTGCPTRVGRANRRAFEITPRRDNSSGQPHRRQTIDYLDQATIDYRDHFGIAELLQRAIDGVFPIHQRRKVDFRRGRCLGILDHVVIWQKPERPEWMDEATYAQMPHEIRVRELRYRVEQPGYRVHEIVLVTTLLDPVVYTKDDLADLYLKRWNIELDLRSIKIVLQMDVLRCKSPDLVDKEIWGHMLVRQHQPES